MEDAFGVIVVIICVIAAVAKSRKNPPQRRGGRPASSFRSESAGQVFQQAFDRLSDKLEPAAKFIDDALTNENGMEVPSARRSAEVFMAQADGEDEESERTYGCSLGNPAANGGADRAAFAARSYDGSLGSAGANGVAGRAGSLRDAGGNARMARDYGGSLGSDADANGGADRATFAARSYAGSLGASAGMSGSLGNPAATGMADRAAFAARSYAGSLGGSAGMSGSLSNPAANGGANRPARNAAPGAGARDYGGSLGAAPTLTREPLAAGMSRADAEGCLGGSLSGHPEEGESRAEHAEHLRKADAQERAILRGEERALHMRTAARTELRRAVVWSEILDRPKALRQR